MINLACHSKGGVSYEMEEAVKHIIHRWFRNLRIEIYIMRMMYKNIADVVDARE